MIEPAGFRDNGHTPCINRDGKLYVRSMEYRQVFQDLYFNHDFANMVDRKLASELAADAAYKCFMAFKERFPDQCFRVKEKKPGREAWLVF